MKAEDVPALTLADIDIDATAEEAYSAAAEQGRSHDQSLGAAIAAIAPLIAAREREACAALVEARGCRADPCCDDIAALGSAIRARGDAP